MEEFEGEAKEVLRMLDSTCLTRKCRKKGRIVPSENKFQPRLDPSSFVHFNDDEGERKGNLGRSSKRKDLSDVLKTSVLGEQVSSKRLLKQIKKEREKVLAAKAKVEAKLRCEIRQREKIEREKLLQAKHMQKLEQNRRFKEEFFQRDEKHRKLSPQRKKIDPHIIEQEMEAAWEKQQKVWKENWTVLEESSNLAGASVPNDYRQDVIVQTLESDTQTSSRTENIEAEAGEKEHEIPMPEEEEASDSFFSPTNEQEQTEQTPFIFKDPLYARLRSSMKALDHLDLPRLEQAVEKLHNSVHALEEQDDSEELLRVHVNENEEEEEYKDPPPESLHEISDTVIQNLTELTMRMELENEMMPWSENLETEFQNLFKGAEGTSTTTAASAAAQSLVKTMMKSVCSAMAGGTR